MTVARVTTPVQGFTGTVVGVRFSEGVAETSDANAIAYFSRQGYAVDAAAAPMSEVTVTWSATAVLKEATLAELRTYAATLSDPALVVTGLNKAATIARIESYREVPTVTGVEPWQGASAGGGEVVITGTGFAEGVVDVLFGSTSAESFTVDSATQITAVAPQGPVSAFDVTVEKEAGVSAPVSYRDTE